MKFNPKNKLVKRVALTMFTVVSLFIIVGILYMQKAEFGKSSRGKRLELLKKSPNYKNGKFHNLSHTPALTEGNSYLSITYDFFFKKNAERIPSKTIPSIKTDLLNLSINENVLIWFGHSSYFIQIDGKRFLIDPVLSGNASPVPGSNKAFAGTDVFNVKDLPETDYLVITHDHYDHLDYQTVVKLKSKVNKVICGLGVGEHLEYWGYSANNIIEKDWNERVELEEGFVIHTTPARHFSGRAFSRNNTLWMSYLLETPTKKIYIGGDSGYDSHFKEIGNTFGPIDLAILENGQYDVKWRYIHMLPEEVLKAAKDLKAKRLFPVHSSKFAMGNHAWDEPLKRLTELNQSENLPLVTPIIGEKVYLNNENQQFSNWWVGVK